MPHLSLLQLAATCHRAAHSLLVPVSYDNPTFPIDVLQGSSQFRVREEALLSSCSCEACKGSTAFQYTTALPVLLLGMLPVQFLTGCGPMIQFVSIPIPGHAS